MNNYEELFTIIIMTAPFVMLLLVAHKNKEVIPNSDIEEALKLIENLVWYT